LLAASRNEVLEPVAPETPPTYRFTQDPWIVPRHLLIREHFSRLLELSLRADANGVVALTVQELHDIVVPGQPFGENGIDVVHRWLRQFELWKDLFLKIKMYPPERAQYVLQFNPDWRALAPRDHERYLALPVSDLASLQPAGAALPFYLWLLGQQVLQGRGDVVLLKKGMYGEDQEMYMRQLMALGWIILEVEPDGDLIKFFTSPFGIDETVNL
jgi:hypothetical protein